MLAATLVGHDGTVFAFEPDPRAASWLRENVARNDLTNVIQVHEAAVSSEAGTGVMTEGHDVCNSLAFGPADLVSTTQQVTTVCLNHLLGEAHPALLKLDVEGYEFEALRGADALLEADPPPVILLEILDHRLRKAGASADTLVSWLDRKRYGLHVYDVPTRQLVAADKIGAKRKNVVAVRRDRLTDVRQRVSSGSPTVGGQGKVQCRSGRPST